MNLIDDDDEDEDGEEIVCPVPCNECGETVSLHDTVTSPLHPNSGIPICKKCAREELRIMRKRLPVGG